LLPAVEAKSTSTDLTPPQPSSGLVGPVKPKPPRGRPRKVKAAAEQSAVLPVPSEPINDEILAGSTPPQANATPAKIQKSELTINEPRSARCGGCGM